MMILAYDGQEMELGHGWGWFYPRLGCIWLRPGNPENLFRVVGDTSSLLFLLL